MPTRALSSSRSRAATERVAPDCAATEPLPRRFFARPVLEVAVGLLGRELVFDSPEGRLGGVIVEVEAYAGLSDPASHAYRGETARNGVMFGPPGYAYVYFTYGMHHCMNVVTGKPGEPSAVLVRALEPRTNLDLWRARRSATSLLLAASGPGRVCKALGLTRAHDGLDLTDSALAILGTRRRRGEVRAGPRVGIRLAPKRPWRFWLADHPSVSRARGSVAGPWPGGGARG